MCGPGTPHLILVRFISSNNPPKALAKNDKNTKALFRKGKALGELGFFEKSEKILSDLLILDLTGTFQYKSHDPAIHLLFNQRALLSKLS